MDYPDNEANLLQLYNAFDFALFFLWGGKGYLFNSWQDQVVIPVYFSDYFKVSYITLTEKTL